MKKIQTRPGYFIYTNLGETDLDRSLPSVWLAPCLIVMVIKGSAFIIKTSTRIGKEGGGVCPAVEPSTNRSDESPDAVSAAC